MTWLRQIKVLASLACVGLVGPIDGKSHPDSIESPGVISAGSLTSVTVVLDQVSDTPTILRIATSSPDDVLTPETVVVPAGEIAVAVPVLASPSLSDPLVAFTATANGVTVGTVVLTN